MIVVWRVTSRCNLSCPFCSFDRTRGGGRQEAELAQRTLALVESARKEAREVINQGRQLMTEIESAKRETFEVNKHQIEFTKLKREVDNNQRLYDLVLAKLKDADLTGRLRTNNVQPIEWAIKAKTPVKPKLPSPITDTHLDCGRPTQAPSAADMEKPSAPCARLVMKWRPGRDTS